MKLKMMLPLTAFGMISIVMSQPQEDPTLTEVWEPVPAVVNASAGHAPADAIVLFDGTDLSAWHGDWKLDGDAVTVAPGAGNLVTKRAFGDVQLHLEWRTPSVVEGEGQERGNSGVFLMERYELQVLDSYENTTYANGQAGSIYKQHIPLVNASRPPGEWQSYDIIFMAPRFRDDGTLSQPATFTVLHNAVLIQNHVTVEGTTVYIGEPEYEPHDAKAPLMLQDHTNPTSYRNIWIREL